jgi:hypothetical protein
MGLKIQVPGKKKISSNIINKIARRRPRKFEEDLLEKGAKKFIDCQGKLTSLGAALVTSHYNSL